MTPLLFSTVALLGLLQLWLLLRNRRLSNSRRGVRLGLNALFWLLLLGFVWQPVWTSPVTHTHALVVGSEVPAAAAQRVQDSLQIKQQLVATAVKPAGLDSITLLGQGFSPDFLARLSGHTLRWLPYEEPDRPLDLRWKGIVRVGEQQQVRGNILATERHKLALRFGDQTLDSLWFPPGRHPFVLRFPTPARGRNEAVLQLDETPQDTIRFFAQTNRPLVIRFVLSTPDFETKTLADWLGQQGHRVTLTSQLSPGIEASLQINPSLRQRNAPETAGPPDLLVTEPALAGSLPVRKTLAAHSNVLIMNVTDPEAEAVTINRALGTAWQFKKTSNEASVPVGNGLMALPYRFVPRINQFSVSTYPVAVQHTAGKVALSLFSETFPLKLSGDSLAYARIWNAVLAQLQPVPANNFELEGPVLARLKTTFTVNKPVPAVTATSADRNASGGPEDEQPALVPELLNAASFSRTYRFQSPGWHTPVDSVEVFADSLLADPRQHLSQWLKAHQQHQTRHVRVAGSSNQQVPDWLWLLLILGALTLLWLEPKW